MSSSDSDEVSKCLLFFVIGDGAVGDRGGEDGRLDGDDTIVMDSFLVVLEVVVLAVFPNFGLTDRRAGFATFTSETLLGGLNGLRLLMEA